MQGEISVRDHMRLQLEGVQFKYAAAKDARIWETFSERPTVYYARLNKLIDEPAAEVAHPATVRRLRRLREARRRVRQSPVASSR